MPEAQESGFAAAAGSDEGDEFSGGDGEGDASDGDGANIGIVRRRETFCDAREAK